MMRGFGQFERRGQKVSSRGHFARRMANAVGLWIAFALVGLLIGMAGYMLTEGMSPVDAYINAAMILSGMGPVTELKTTAGKVFAGTYAIFSGLFLVVAAGFILAPIFHRVLHRFHVESSKHEE